MTTRSTLYTVSDIPFDGEPEGYGYLPIKDMQYYTPYIDSDMSKPVSLPRSSQSEEPIPVFDTKTTGLYFMRSMWGRKQAFCALGSDGLVGIQVVSWVKLLIFDSSCPYMQRLFASFLPVYAGGRTMFLNRFTSDCVVINEALESIGKRINTKNELISNSDLNSENVFMLIFDQNWSEDRTFGRFGLPPYQPDSLLVDSLSLPGFHSVYPNNYIKSGLPGSRLEYKRE
jgi:hypothetical protein